MTKQEFLEWFQYHVTAFPSCRSWLKKFPKGSEHDPPAKFGDEPTQRAILSNWYKTLEKSTIEDAKKASDTLAASDEDFNSFDRIPGKILGIANRLRRDRKFIEPKPNDGREARYNCWRCQDTGFVPIVPPKDIKTIEETWPDGPPDRFDYNPLASEAVRPLHFGRHSCACSCSLGARMTGIIQYDSEKDCYYPHGTKESYQQIRDWFAARAVRIAESRKFKEWV